MIMTGSGGRVLTCSSNRRPIASSYHSLKPSIYYTCEPLYTALADPRPSVMYRRTKGIFILGFFLCALPSSLWQQRKNRPPLENVNCRMGGTYVCTMGE